MDVCKPYDDHCMHDLSILEHLIHAGSSGTVLALLFLHSPTAAPGKGVTDQRDAFHSLVLRWVGYSCMKTFCHIDSLFRLDVTGNISPPFLNPNS